MSRTVTFHNKDRLEYFEFRLTKYMGVDEKEYHFPALLIENTVKLQYRKEETEIELRSMSIRLDPSDKRKQQSDFITVMAEAAILGNREHFGMSDGRYAYTPFKSKNALDVVERKRKAELERTGYLSNEEPVNKRVRRAKLFEVADKLRHELELGPVRVMDFCVKHFLSHAYFQEALLLIKREEKVIEEIDDQYMRIMSLAQDEPEPEVEDD